MKLTTFAGSKAGLIGGGASAVSALGFAVVPQGGQLGPAGLNFSSRTFNDFKGGVCVNTYLGQNEKDLLNKANASNNGWQNQKDKFTNPTGQAKGCVAIALNKKTWDNDHWKGEIKWEWLFSMGPETLVSYGLYNTEEDKSKIQWKSMYVNKEKKESDGMLWEGDEKTAPKSPKFSREWDFIPDYDQICTTSHGCIGQTKEESAGEIKWTWEEDEANGNNRFSDWTKNFNDAFQSLNSRLIQNSPTSQFFNKLVEKKGFWTKR